MLFQNWTVNYGLNNVSQTALQNQQFLKSRIWIPLFVVKSHFQAFSSAMTTKFLCLNWQLKFPCIQMIPEAETLNVTHNISWGTGKNVGFSCTPYQFPTCE